MKTKVFEIASDKSPAVSEYPNYDPANPPNGKVLSLPGWRRIPSINGHDMSKIQRLAQEKVMRMDLFNSLQTRHLDANNPGTGGNKIQ
jgi:hypothetical protein